MIRPRAGWVAVVAAASTAGGIARGQAVDVERPRTLVVGSPPAGSTTGRTRSSADTGASSTHLPAATLRTRWRVSLEMSVEHPPALDARGTVYVVGSRGEVVALSPAGEELWRLAGTFAHPGASTVLSDGTVVFVGGGGEAVAVRDGSTRWHAKLAGVGTARPAPLALDDGGLVAAAGNQVVALDADGHERSRVVLAERECAALVAVSDEVAVVTTSGTIWTWRPGAVEAFRAASFGAAIDTSTVLADARVLVAVTADGARLVAADLLYRTATVLDSISGDLLLGPPAAVGRRAISILDLTPAGEFALALDPARGSELYRAWIGPAPGLAFDAGFMPRPAVPHVAPLVDSEGTLAFAAADGAVGVVAHFRSPPSAVERLPEICPPPPGAGPSAGSLVVGLAPLPPNALLVSCRSGTIVAVGGG